jgi:hypothetical protein
MYRVIGADQREYWPVTEEQVRQWIKEGRTNGNTIARFEDKPWKPLSTFPEFASDLTQVSLPGLAGGTPSATPSLLIETAPKNHPLAVPGLVLGVLSWVHCCCLTPLFSIAAAVISVIALVQINQQPEKWTGRNLATAGVILAVASLVFTIAWHFWFGGGKFRFAR